MDDNITHYRDRLSRRFRYSKQSQNVKSCFVRFNFLAVGSIDDMSIIPLLLCFSRVFLICSCCETKVGWNSSVKKNVFISLFMAKSLIIFIHNHNLIFFTIHNGLIISSHTPVTLCYQFHKPNYIQYRYDTATITHIFHSIRYSIYTYSFTRNLGSNCTDCYQWVQLWVFSVYSSSDSDVSVTPVFSSSFVSLVDFLIFLLIGLFTFGANFSLSFLPEMRNSPDW